MENRIINLFYWFACPTVESKAFLCIQQEKDEEEWSETNLNILYVEDRGMKMKTIAWGVRTWPALFPRSPDSVS